jgi:hypothetical protein
MLRLRYVYLACPFCISSENSALTSTRLLSQLHVHLHPITRNYLLWAETSSAIRRLTKARQSCPFARTLRSSSWRRVWCLVTCFCSLWISAAVRDERSTRRTVCFRRSSPWNPVLKCWMGPRTDFAEQLKRNVPCLGWKCPDRYVSIVIRKYIWILVIAVDTAQMS